MFDVLATSIALSDLAIVQMRAHPASAGQATTIAVALGRGANATSLLDLEPIGRENYFLAKLNGRRVRVPRERCNGPSLYAGKRIARRRVKEHCAGQRAALIYSVTRCGLRRT